jgi:hypothetical protein
MEQAIDKLSKATSILVNNICAYLHISELIKEMEINNLIFYPQKSIDGIKKRLKDLKRDGWLKEETIHRIIECIDDEIKYNTRLPAQYAMTTTEVIVDINADGLCTRHAKKKNGPSTNWPINFLLYSLLQDVHYYGNRNEKHYREIGDFLTSLEVENENGFSDDNIRKKYDSISQKDKTKEIFKLIKHCHKWAKATGKEFLPLNTEVIEMPNNFLTILSHRAGFKLSPYLATAGKSGKPLSSSVKTHRK